jgi:hypothetical protein
VLSLVLGAFGLLGALFVTVVFGTLGAMIGASQESDAAIGVAVIGLTGIAVTIYLVVTSVASVLCGWGLLQRRRWARILGIVLSAVSLINFPIGTALGIYGLWVLFNKQTEAMFGTA